MATPSIANLDNDNFKEIVFYGYTNSGDVFAINHNGTPVNNFPVEINEKILNWHFVKLLKITHKVLST